MTDISCDTTNPNNPVPIYGEHLDGTTLFEPVLRVVEAKEVFSFILNLMICL
jgi:hypothetical protein